MSYLNAVRLVFAGQFQADPSTVNNDVRHFDNADFLPQYQDYQQGAQADGWWNPNGTGAFRFIDCAVCTAYYADGTSTSSKADDPIIGLSVLNSNDRSSGKLVDLDPQWQLASQIWGMQVRLADVAAQSATTWLTSTYAENPFRDLWFTRTAGKGGDGAASAIFQSVLTGLDWAANLPNSRLLTELLAATQDGQLSIRLVTYAYKDDYTQSGFTQGILAGVIGPYLSGEPASIVVGRRFAPANGNVSFQNINFFTGNLTPNGLLLLDLCNALPLDSSYNPVSVGTLTAGTLLSPALAEQAPLDSTSYQPIGTVPYLDPNWLLQAGGIAAFQLTPAQLANQSPGSFLPLTLASQAAGAASPVVAIRETANGLFLGAEPFVLRIDSSANGPVTATSTLYASAYGLPAPGASLQIAQTGAMPGLGGGYGTHQPTAPIPVAGVPTAALNFPASLTAGGGGTSVLSIQGSPPDNPRGYIDGQLYNVTYQQAAQSTTEFGPFELIAIHLRDAYPVPDVPTWTANIQPIFAQYGNLYPIMSKFLVQLNDPVSVYEHRKLLTLAFSLDIQDPNYMPVTRDLSEAKRQTILKWFARIDQDTDFQRLLTASKPRTAAPKRVAAAAAVATASPGGKTTFAQSLAKSRGG